MYTRCPSCRAEISFEPPANAASLPDGYKHKIKCPSCGVTIGVKIPRIDAEAIQPTFTPANPNAAPSETVFSAAPVPVSSKEAEKEMKKEKKSGGRGKNVFMLILSLLAVVVSCLGYLYTKGTLKVEIMAGLAIFDGISPIELLIKDAKSLFEDIPTAIITLLPTIFFLLAAIEVIVTVIGTAVNRYGKTFNLIWGLLIVGAAVCTLLQPVLYGAALGIEVGIGDYFKGLIEDKAYLAFVGAGLGVLIFLCSLFCLGGKKKKA